MKYLRFLRATALPIALSAAALPAELFPLGPGTNGAADGWSLFLGSEFPGAQGCWALVDEPGASTGRAFYLEGAFGQGGAYVSLDKKLTPAVPFKTLTFKVKSAEVVSLMIRLRDAKGVHQHLEKLQATDAWQTVVVRDFKGERYTAYGGAAKGVFTQPLTGISILLEERGLSEGHKLGRLLLADLSLEY